MLYLKNNNWKKPSDVKSRKAFICTYIDGLEWT